MSKPLLSICIPTYNRAAVLDQSLASLVKSKRFEEIEVVVSDNCSSDGTEAVVSRFQRAYPNIKYFKNSENVSDRNFLIALLRANGVCRRLCNDRLLYKDDAIAYMLDSIACNMANRPLLLFSNGAARIEIERCHNLDELVNCASHLLAWISAFGLWDDYCNNLESEFELCDSYLWQTYKFLSCFEKKMDAVVLNKEIVVECNVKSKNLSYGVVKVFYDNLLNILHGYVEKGSLLKVTEDYVKKDLLFTLFSKHIVQYELQSDVYDFGQQHLKNDIYSRYETEPYFDEFKKYLSKIIKREKRKNVLLNFKNKYSSNHFVRFLLCVKRKFLIKLY